MIEFSQRSLKFLMFLSFITTLFVFYKSIDSYINKNESIFFYVALVFIALSSFYTFAEKYFAKLKEQKPSFLSENKRFVKFYLMSGILLSLFSFSFLVVVLLKFGFSSSNEFDIIYKIGSLILSLFVVVAAYKLVKNNKTFVQ